MEEPAADQINGQLDKAAERAHRKVVRDLIAQCPEAHRDHQLTKLRKRVEEALLRDWE